LLFFVTFFIGRKFCKLFFTSERGKVCYFLLLFLLLITLINYFLLLRRAKVYRVFIVRGGNLKGCKWRAWGVRVVLRFIYLFLV
jgi:hypothetical protein